MASKIINTSIRPTVVVASSSTSKESSSTTNDKVSKKSKNNSKSNSKNHDEKSRKRKKRQHKSKKNHDEKHETIDEPPPLPPSDEKTPPPPPPPSSPPISNLYDGVDENITTSTPVVKTNLLLSHSPPPVMPTILRQGSRARLTTKEQLVPSSAIRTTNDNNKLSPTSTTNLPNTEDLATKKFEEQLALLDASSSKLTMNNWDQSSGGSEEDEQIERICRMNNTGSISGPIQFKFNRTQNLLLKTSPVSNDVPNNEEETVPIMNSTKKKRLHKPNDPPTSSHSSLSGDENEKKTRTKKQKLSENETTESVTKIELPATSTIVPITHDESIKTEVIKNEEPVASTTNEKKSEGENGGDDGHRDSRSTSAASSRRRKHSSHRRHRRRHRRRRSSSSSSSRSSYTSTSSDSSRSSSSRSHRRRRRRRSPSSRSSSRSSSSSSDNRGRRTSRRSSRSYSRDRSSTSRSSRSSTSSRSSQSRSRSRSHNRKSSRRSNHNRPQQSNNNGKGRGGGVTRRGRGARNGPRGRRAQSNENLHRSSPNKNVVKYNSTLGTGGRKLPNNKQPRVLIAATPKVEENIEETTATSTTIISTEEIKSEPIILTTNQIQQRSTGQKKNAKGKSKQQTPAYSLKKEETDDMDHGDGEPMIGPKLPPEFEKKITKEHSFTPPDMDDPENIEMLNDLKYRAEIHAAKNHGLINEMQAQQLIEERETQKQLAELPLIQMPIIPSQTISSMGSFIVAAPSPVLANYQIQMAPTATSQIAANHDPSSITFEQQQQNPMSPNSAASSGGESCSTPGQTTPNGTSTVLTQEGQQMMIQTGPNGTQQLVQIAQSPQQLYMPMQNAVQQPRVVAVRTPQGGLQHFIEYPTAQLLQAQQQQQQQPQFIQHNGQLVQVIRSPMAYSSATLMQQLQLQQQQQQVFAAQIQAQQIAAMQQSGGAIFLQNAAGQLVLAQPNPQAMRVVQIPYVPK